MVNGRWLAVDDNRRCREYGKNAFKKERTALMNNLMDGLIDGLMYDLLDLLIDGL